MSGLAMKTVSSSHIVKEIALCYAVISVHGELEKDDKGVATITLRRLLRIADTGKIIDPVLTEYVCGFGAHGLQVLQRAASINNISKDVFEQYVATYSDRLRKEISAL